VSALAEMRGWRLAEHFGGRAFATDDDLYAAAAALGWHRFVVDDAMSALAARGHVVEDLYGGLRIARAPEGKRP